MAEVYGPFDAGIGATFGEDGWAKLMRTIAGDGIIYQYATEITSPYVGPAENALKVTASGGLDYAVGVGIANIHGHLYENTTSLTRTVGTPGTTAGQSRNDIVVIRKDSTLNTITVVTIQGTNAVSPVDPAILRNPTQWDIPLARINVPANAVNLGTITDLRQFAYIPPELMPPVPKKSSTATSAFTTETKDTQVGDYQFQAFGGRRYRVCANVRVQVSVAATVVDVRVRDSGSASSPTISSTLLVATSGDISQAGGPGATTRHMQKPLENLTPGLHTVAIFGARTAGTGTVTLDTSAGDTRDLWVEDITSRAG